MNPQGSVGYTTFMRHAPIKLLHFSDTHVREKDELHPVVKEALKEADWVVHTGDFTGPTLVHQLIEDHPKFVGVFGNTDKDETRRILPDKQFFAIGQWRFGIIHPWWGMEPDGIEDRILQELGVQDIILYGHTHERVEHYVGDTLIVNPGPGYPDFMMPGSVAMLTLHPTSIDVEFRVFERPSRRG